MSCSKWAYTPERCDGKPCIGDCDWCRANHDHDGELANNLPEIGGEPMYEDLVERLREHQCDAGEDDTQDICEECQYDVIIADKNTFSGIRKVCICGLMNEAADAIEHMQKQLQKSEENNINLTGWLAEEHAKHLWIPVTERLPGKDTRVIVCASLPEGVHSDFIYEDGHWFVSIGVTHWMPLPEPPKEESNGV